LLGIAVLGCSRPESAPADAAPDWEAEQFPGPLPGWEDVWDGITCRHPPVQGDCKDGWCRIPPGCFVKGSPLDEIGHPATVENQVAVILTRGFWIQQYEVTQADWIAMALHNPAGPFMYQAGGDCTGDPRCPVGNVTWFEALGFANLLSEKHDPPLSPCYMLVGCTGELGSEMVCQSAALTTPTLYECEGYRLPSDAEWEYAIRASTRTAFYSGDIVLDAGGPSECEPYAPAGDVAWYCANSGDFTHPVGQKRANAWHLYDMAGNAAEWVHDVEDGKAPPPGPLQDPGGDLPFYQYRKARGGSAIGWPTLLRSASALGYTWGYRRPTLGFRLVRTMPPNEAQPDGG
jgi:formylglycine-generating enzyme required for sulfatase activity